MLNDRYLEYIKIAESIVLKAALHPQYQPVAFEIILRHLIESDKE